MVALFFVCIFMYTFYVVCAIIYCFRNIIPLLKIAEIRINKGKAAG